ncbi:hypothetical protein ACQP2P_44255 [Dactylosporangium sp. CA-139114]|uniref:hypothetical protein n=1 Tax=Dactylosporangium sp. CA-139114 TaxID=3239931 RepID=UPI003D95F10C
MSFRKGSVLERYGAYPQVYAISCSVETARLADPWRTSWFGPGCARQLRYVRSRQEHNAIPTTDPTVDGFRPGTPDDELPDNDLATIDGLVNGNLLGWDPETVRS